MCWTDAMSLRHTGTSASAAAATANDGDPVWMRPRSAKTGTDCAPRALASTGQAIEVPCSAAMNPGTTRTCSDTSCEPSRHRSR